MSNLPFSLYVALRYLKSTRRDALITFLSATAAGGIALGIAVALTALWLSPFKVHPQISMIMWVSMLTAALAALVVIPALTDREGLRVPE